MYEENIILDLTKRDEFAEHFEILDKVKRLLLINKLDVATIKQEA